MIPAVLLLVLCPLAMPALALEGDISGIKEFTEPFMLPQVNLRALVVLTGKLHGKPVFVEREVDLAAPVSFILTHPVSGDAARKTIRAVLAVEGYDLVEDGDKLRLKRMLTREQVSMLKSNLTRRSRDKEERPAVKGKDSDKDWLVEE